MPNPTAIHISDVNTFKTCRRKWDWSSPLRRNLEPDRTYIPFFVGRVVHTALERFYGYGEALTPALEDAIVQEESTLPQLFDEERRLFNEASGLARWMIFSFDQWRLNPIYRDKPWSDNNLEYLSVEHEFEVPLLQPSGRVSPHVSLAGRIDGLMRRKDTGDLYLHEIKTSARPSQLKQSLANNEQVSAYTMAAQRLLGEPVAGMMFTVLLKRIPKAPQALKNGNLSVNRSTDTSFEAFMHYARLHHEGWADKQIVGHYRDYLLYLAQEREPKYVERFFVRRTPHELEVFERDLYNTALEMRNPRAIYPSPSPIACNMCSFREPCLAMNLGYDTEFILRADYRQRVVAHEEEDTNGSTS